LDLILGGSPFSLCVVGVVINYLIVPILGIMTHITDRKEMQETIVWLEIHVKSFRAQGYRNKTKVIGIHVSDHFLSFTIKCLIFFYSLQHTREEIVIRIEIMIPRKRNHVHYSNTIKKSRPATRICVLTKNFKQNN